MRRPPLRFLPPLAATLALGLGLAAAPALAETARPETPATAAPAAPGWLVVAPLPAGDPGLAIRAEPRSDAPLLTRLPEGALVTGAADQVRTDALWREVAVGEVSGWAAARYLSPARFRTLEGTDMPEAGACGGFEPMWRLAWSENEIVFERMGEDAQPRPVTALPRAEGRLTALIEAGADPADRLLFRYEDEQCRETPLDAPVWGRGTVILTENGQTTWLVGCCRPSPEALAPAEE